MTIQPVLASLRKHKIPAFLIVLEIALACAVLCNAVFMISQRIGEIHVANAIDERGIVDIRVAGTDPALAHVDIPRNLAALRQISGVKAVAAMSTVPLSNNGWNSNVATGPGELLAKNSPNVATYFFTQGGPDALGLQLEQGRFFSDSEYADSKLGNSYLASGPLVILTHSLAKRLWPDQPALGKPIWIGDQNRYTVIGVVADVLRPNQNGLGAAGFHWGLFFPISPNPMLHDYVVRTTPDARDRVFRAGVEKLAALAPNAVIKGKTFSEVRDQYFADTRSMVWMLLLVCVVMLAVTAFGIVGLSSFWVAQRRAQIGIRRALGATRSDIMAYFQTENFLIVSVGIVLGMLAAFGLNLLLMHSYELPRLPYVYLPLGAVALWVLGQLAVLAPALRAAKVPPVVAMRGA